MLILHQYNGIAGWTVLDQRTVSMRNGISSSFIHATGTNSRGLESFLGATKLLFHYQIILNK